VVNLPDESAATILGPENQPALWRKHSEGKIERVDDAAFQDLLYEFRWSIKRRGRVRRAREILLLIPTAAAAIEEKIGRPGDNKFSTYWWTQYQAWEVWIMVRYGKATYEEVPTISFEEFKKVLLDILCRWYNGYQVTDSFFPKTEEQDPPLQEIDAGWLEFGWLNLIQDGVIHLQVGPPRGGKTNSDSYIARNIAGKMFKGAEVHVITNVSFYDRTLKSYPNIHRCVYLSDVFFTIGQLKVKYGAAVKILVIWDEADATIRTTGRTGKKIGWVGVFTKQMGKFGVSLLLNFKHLRDADPKWQDKNMPGGTIGYKLHMGAYPIYKGGKATLGYFKKQGDRQQHLLLEDDEGNFVPPISNIPNEARYYQHDMITHLVLDLDMDEFVNEAMKIRPARDASPKQLDAWHREQGWFLLEGAPLWKLGGESLRAARDAAILEFLEEIQEKIEDNRATWNDAATFLKKRYRVTMTGIQCREKWRRYRRKMDAEAVAEEVDL